MFLLSFLLEAHFLITEDFFFFLAGSLYKVILSGNVDGGVTGSSTYKVKVNDPPKYGGCKVTPTEGQPLQPVFNVSCDGFDDDPEDLPFKYEFFYEYGNIKTSLGYGLDSFRSLVSLPPGDKFKFTVVASDKWGASRKYDIPASVTVSYQGRKKVYYMAELVHREKEHSDWFPERSVFCYMDR